MLCVGAPGRRARSAVVVAPRARVVCVRAQGTQISPWVVTREALEPFSTDPPLQDPPVLPYLRAAKHVTQDVHLAVDIVPAGHAHASARVATTNFKHMCVASRPKGGGGAVHSGGTFFIHGANAFRAVSRRWAQVLDV